MGNEKPATRVLGRPRLLPKAIAYRIYGFHFHRVVR
jgi:hypothetical protein